MLRVPKNIRPFAEVWKEAWNKPAPPHIKRMVRHMAKALGLKKAP
jgi:hypothetical protein